MVLYSEEGECEASCHRDLEVVENQVYAIAYFWVCRPRRKWEETRNAYAADTRYAVQT
jgi:hypothetical protein